MNKQNQTYQTEQFKLTLDEVPFFHIKSNESCYSTNPKGSGVIIVSAKTGLSKILQSRK